MRDLSLYILDIVQNSIRAGATEIMIQVNEDIRENWLTLKIVDNGKGMPEKLARKVLNPFVTTRTSRKVGLGLSLLAQRCQLCEGSVSVISKQGKGTSVIAKMRQNHIDRVPIGDIGSTMMTLITETPHINYCYIYQYNTSQFTLDTEEIKKILGDVAINESEILLWLKNYVNKSMKNINKNS